MRHTLALAAAAVLVVGAPTAASAKTWDHEDPAGDVMKYTYNTDTDEETETVDPTVTNGDVIHSTIKHNPRKVIAKLTFRDLVAPTDGPTLYILSMRTGRLKRDLMVVADPENARGSHQFSRGSNGRPVRCRGAAHHIDYTANTITMSVPRSCLARPRFVSAGAASVRLTGFDAPGPTDSSVIEQYLDDAHSPKIGDNLVFSPRLRRG